MMLLFHVVTPEFGTFHKSLLVRKSVFYHYMSDCVLTV